MKKQLLLLSLFSISVTYSATLSRDEKRKLESAELKAATILINTIEKKMLNDKKRAEQMLAEINPSLFTQLKKYFFN